MPRTKRSYDPGAIYHLTSHGVDDRPIFRDDNDRERFVDLLTRAQRRYDWRLYAVCLMDTHHHLVLSAKAGVIAAGMRDVNGGHSRIYNERHSRRGSLFESRYRDRQIRNDAHLLGAIRYVALNPVEAGMVARPEDWPWSTYAQLVGAAAPWPCFAPVLVLAHFGRDRDSAIERVKEFVDEALAKNRV